jgi:hypothetical protein
MLKMMLPVGASLLVKVMFKAGRENPSVCKQTRQDIDRRLTQLILEW